MKYTPSELQAMISAPSEEPRAGYSPSTRGIGVKCRAKCAGGNECLCNAKYRHQLHACKDVDCMCHSKAYLYSKRKVTP